MEIFRRRLPNFMPGDRVVDLKTGKPATVTQNKPEQCVEIQIDGERKPTIRFLGNVIGEITR